MQTKWERDLELLDPLHFKSRCKVPRSASGLKYLANRVYFVRLQLFDEELKDQTDVQGR